MSSVYAPPGYAIDKVGPATRSKKPEKGRRIGVGVDRSEIQLVRMPFKTGGRKCPKYRSTKNRLFG